MVNTGSCVQSKATFSHLGAQLRDRNPRGATVTAPTTVRGGRQRGNACSVVAISRKSFDAVVIGSGETGVSAALELAKSGRNTLYVTREPSARQSARVLPARQVYDSPELIALSAESLNEWRAIEGTSGSLLQATGCLDVFWEERAHELDATSDVLRSAGVRARLLSAADVQNRWGVIRNLPKGSAALLTDGGCLDPALVREALLARFVRLGGSIEAGEIISFDDRASHFSIELNLDSGLGMRKVEFEQLLVAPGPFEQGLLAFAKCEPQVKNVMRGIAAAKTLDDAPLFEEMPLWRAFARASQMDLELAAAEESLARSLIAVADEKAGRAPSAAASASGPTTAADRNREAEFFPSRPRGPLVAQPAAARADAAARLSAQQEAGPAAWGGPAWAAGLKLAQGLAAAHLGPLGQVSPAGVSYAFAAADGLPAVGCSKAFEDGRVVVALGAGDAGDLFRSPAVALACRRLLDCSGPGTAFATRFALSRKALGPPDEDQEPETAGDSGEQGSSRGGDTASQRASATRSEERARQRQAEEQERRRRAEEAEVAAEREERERFDRKRKEESGGGVGDIWQGRPKPGSGGGKEEVEVWGRGRKL